MSSAAKQCVKDEHQRCVDEHHINGIIRFYVGLMRQYLLLGGPDGGPEPEELVLARDLTAKCLTFELRFHSEGSLSADGGSYNSTMDGKVTLHFDPTSFTISGSGPNDNLSFEFRMPKGGSGMTCTANSKTGGSTFEAKTLEYVEDTRSETDPELYVRDFRLLYFPGVTRESHTVHCILTDSQLSPADMLQAPQPCPRRPVRVAAPSWIWPACIRPGGEPSCFPSSSVAKSDLAP